MYFHAISLLTLLWAVEIIATPWANPIQQRAVIARVHLEQRQAVTYAQTCSFYGLLIDALTASSCNTPAPTISGPYVTVNCLGVNSVVAVCGGPTTVSSCVVTSTSTQRIVVIAGVLTNTNLIPISSCTTPIYAPTPAAVSATTTSSTVRTTSVSSSIQVTTTSSLTQTSSSSTSLASSSTTSTTSSVVSIPTDLTCFADNVNGQRTLGGATTSNSAMTNALCQSYCNSRGFAYSGTEYANECFCGQVAPSVRSTNCNMLCAASGSSELCGGPNALNVRFNAAVAQANAQAAAVAASYTSRGCYKDNYPQRVLAVTSTTSPVMTVESCLNFCGTNNFNLAGLENGSECYCANSIVSDGSTYGVGNQVGCTFGCAGNFAEICGGNNLLSLYSRSGVIVVQPPTTTTTASTSGTSSPPATSSTPAFTPLPALASGYRFLACYLDSNTRTLTKQLADVSSVEACVTGCSSQGFRYAGLEYYSQCFCGNEIVNNGATIISNQNCNYACNGGPGETCGGAFALQVYSGTPVPTGSVVRIPSGAQGYTYVDTFVDSAASRVLPFVQTLASTTVESCISTCAKAGYPLAGVEYGAECFCGSALPNNPVGGQVPTMTCQGASTEYCGGPNAMQVYRGTPPGPQFLTAPFIDGQCVTDNVNNLRTLSAASFAASNMTPALCKTRCQGFRYFGVEYSTECYCGDTFASNIPLSSGCNMACGGDSAQFCGGGYALNVYNNL